MMSKKDFERLLGRVLDGTASDQEKRWVEQWYASMEQENRSPVLSPSEQDAADREDWEKIKSRTKPRTLTLWPILAVAAALAFVAVAFVQLVVTPPSPDASQTAERADTRPEVFVNASGSTRVVTLPDSTVVTLQPNSKIRLDRAFNEAHRKVFLKGEAFFKVKHNASKPFYVYAKEVVTTVLGTSFTVKAFPGDDITVSVMTGRVSVARKQPDEERVANPDIVLTPNQQAVYSREEDKVSRMLVPEPQVIIPPEEVKKIIHFEKTPVSQILRSLEKMYGIDIVFDEARLSACSLTTSGSEQSLYETIDIICEAIGATYTVNEVQVKIDGNGCN